MVHITEIVLKRLYVTQVVRFVVVKFIYLLLHSTSLGNQIFHDQVHIVVCPLEMNDLSVHARDLLFHLCDLLLSGANVTFQLFYLVIEYELELLQLLGFLLQFVYSHHLVSDCLLSLFDLL